MTLSNGHPAVGTAAARDALGSSWGRSIELRPFSEIRRGSVEWLLEGRVPLGMLTLLIGDAGLGKSLFTCLLAAQLSRGELIRGLDAATVMLTAEDSRAVTMRPRLEAVGARLELVHSYDLRTADGLDEGGLVIPADLPMLEEAIGKVAARLVTIDPLGAHLPGSINPWQDQSVRQALAPLARLAESSGCAIVAVLHLNKRDSTDALRRINGSTGFGAAARSVLLATRDPDDPDGAVGRRRVLSHAKCNVGPLASSQLYEVEPITLPARTEEPEALTARLRLIGETPRNGAELLGRDLDHERSALDEAKDFLREELVTGPRPAKEIGAAARAAGIAQKTLERARREVCHKPKKCGFTGPWEWALKSTPLSPSEESQTLSPPGAEAVDGHLRANPHRERASVLSGRPEPGEDGHNGDRGAFAVPENEQAILSEFAKTLDARELQSRREGQQRRA